MSNTILKGDIVLVDHKGRPVYEEKILSTEGALLTVQFNKVNEFNNKDIILESIQLKQDRLQLEAIHYSRYMDFYLLSDKQYKRGNALLHKNPDISDEKAFSYRETQADTWLKKMDLLEKIYGQTNQKNNGFINKMLGLGKKSTKNSSPQLIGSTGAPPLSEAVAVYDNIDHDFISKYENAADDQEKIKLCYDRLKNLFSDMFENKEEWAKKLYEKYKDKLKIYEDKFNNPIEIQKSLYEMTGKEIDNPNLRIKNDQFLDDFRRIMDTDPGIDPDLRTCIKGTLHTFFLAENPQHFEKLKLLIKDQIPIFKTVIDSGISVNFSPVIMINASEPIAAYNGFGYDTYYKTAEKISDPKRIIDVINEEMCHKTAQLKNLDFDKNYLEAIASDIKSNGPEIKKFFDERLGVLSKLSNKEYAAESMPMEVRINMFFMLKNGSENDKEKLKQLMPESTPFVEKHLKMVKDLAAQIRGQSKIGDLPGTNILSLPYNRNNMSPQFDRAFSA